MKAEKQGWLTGGGSLGIVPCVALLYGWSFMAASGVWLISSSFNDLSAK